ncbi:hypothetical protein [Paenibacillus taichungensis]|uniref:hypothetical protein n=1 Tax=Paenibacillus taichungensis TaxID=484184 RepID=UPI0039A26A2F
MSSFSPLLRKAWLHLFTENDAIQIISQVVPSHVYDNWLTCMTSMIECVKKQGYGLHNDVIRNGNELIIKVWYSPYNPQDSWPKLVSDMYVPDGAECKHDCLKTGDMIEREVTFIFKRSSGINGTIAINTDKGSILIPLVPYIEGNSSVNMQENIKMFVQQAYTSTGGKLNGFELPSDRKEHEQYNTFGDVVTGIENFTGAGTSVKCEIVLSRRNNTTYWLNTITKNLNTGEETDTWEKDTIAGTPFKINITIDLDYSKIEELNSIIFCASPGDIVKYAFLVDELCLSGRELAKQIIEWLD